MQKTFKLLSFFIATSLLLCACGNNVTPTKVTRPKRPDVVFNIPTDIISEKDYINRVEKLCATKTFTEVDDNFLSNVDDLGNDLKDMITYNQDDIEVKGTKYYVSNDGKDTNDGLTHETAWATLDKVHIAELKEGDAVLFRRGDFFRGQLITQNGVTYSAYGEGFKPQISCSLDGLTYAKWVETDTPNVWKLDAPIPNDDIAVIVFNLGESYAEKKMSMTDLKANFDFCHYNSLLEQKKPDNRVYMYCDKGNPADLFWSMEISPNGCVVDIKNSAKNITLHNLELRCGGYMGFFPSATSNIKALYCTFAWVGGSHNGTCRLGGGAGCWYGCDTMIFEHCYFYQQFDSGVTPQYHMNDEEPCIYKNFRTTACLFEYCEYPFEYFMVQENCDGGKYINTYFGYNFVRYTGYGFGDKPTQSACVKSWSAKNSQENFVIEKNIFDRPYTRALDMGAKNENGDFDFDEMPFMNNNVYISNKGRSLIRLNEQRFRFNEEGYGKLSDLGFETNAVYLFCNKY